MAVRLSRAEDEHLLDVRDNGPGIAPAERERVFDWFFQGERSHHGRVQGSGLGLAIARDLVLAHGGRIEVVDDGAAADAAAGAGGAHFRVVLPFRGATSAQVK